ncbi:endonuclease/exonuclease/phosphatase family protein [Candidatus Marinimicrobia bacterium]|nr:endonuclease/exonuclease/phosphatase family protein [Candidatus Neomarinimicrobiota bacterium]
MKIFKIPLLFILLIGCDPFVTEFSETENAVMYKASNIPGDSDVYDDGALKVVTWNIRFGSGRFPFFGDSCGDEVISENSDVKLIMQAIADTLNKIDADIVLLQEVDVSSKRTGYLDQVQYLLENTYLNYGCYASMWKADFIPTDGIGKINTGNAILSRYEITEAERVELRLRTDQDDLIQYFYLRRNILKAKIPSLAQSGKDFFAVDIHATAFATDDTKQQHLIKYSEVLSEIANNNGVFVSGGDLNSVPPNSTVDFCMLDKCDSEKYVDSEGSESEYHSIDSSAGPHKEGAFFDNFEGEPDILQPLYNNYSAAISHANGSTLDSSNYTHAPSTSYERHDIKYDRKLDYLFTNGSWEDGSGYTHQEAWALSDHMPVSAIFIPVFEQEL